MKSYVSLKRIKNQVYWHVKLRGNLPNGNSYRNQKEINLLGRKADDYLASDYLKNGENSLLIKFLQNRRKRFKSLYRRQIVQEPIIYTLTYSD